MLKEFLESGAVRPVIDRTFPLQQTLAALRQIEAGKAGFALQWTARAPFSNGMLFRSGAGPREYQVVKTRRLATLENLTTEIPTK